MVAVPLQSPYCEFFNNNGDPLSGGKVYSYLAGTVTPQATYTTYTGLIPNANPVILDSSGRAEIWIIGTYRFDVFDSNNVLIKSVDNVAALNNGGDMTAAVYDPANIQQQVVGTTASQTLTNKTLTSPVISAPTIAGFSTEPTMSRYSSGTGVSNNTFIDLPSMTWDLGIGTYEIGMTCFVTQLAAGGNKVQTVFSGTQTAYWGAIKISNTGTGAPVTFVATSSVGALGNSTTGTTNLIECLVKITVSVAGTFKFQVAQQATNASASSFQLPTGYARLPSL